jgi:hypothetical protein
VITYLGSLTLGALIPKGAEAGAAAVAAIELALPDLQARLAALASFAPSPGNFAADIALAQGIVTSIEAAIAVGISPPSLDAQIAIVAALVAELEAALAAINAQLSIVTDFLALLDTGGVFAYAFSGNANALGGEFATELASGFPGGGATDPTNALLFATTTPATWSAMSTVFKVTP